MTYRKYSNFDKKKFIEEIYFNLQMHSLQELTVEVFISMIKSAGSKRRSQIPSVRYQVSAFRCQVPVSKCQVFLFFFCFVFFFLGFLSRTFTNYRTVGKRGGHFFNSLLPIPPASQTLRHYPGDYCRELTSSQS